MYKSPSGLGNGSSDNVKQEIPPERKGKLAAVACSVLMQVLYAARTVRQDLLHAIGHLACFITSWTHEQDDGLHWLMRNISATLHWRHISWVGDAPEDVTAHLFCDADFAGDQLSMRSTNGLYLCLRGPKPAFRFRQMPNAWGAPRTQPRRQS